MPWAWLEGKEACESGLKEKFLEERKNGILASTPKKKACSRKKSPLKTATAICHQNRSSSR